MPLIHSKKSLIAPCNEIFVFFSSNVSNYVRCCQPIFLDALSKIEVTFGFMATDDFEKEEEKWNLWIPQRRLLESDPSELWAGFAIAVQALVRVCLQPGLRGRVEWSGGGLLGEGMWIAM